MKDLFRNLTCILRSVLGLVDVEPRPNVRADTRHPTGSRRGACCVRPEPRPRFLQTHFKRLWRSWLEFLLSRRSWWAGVALWRVLTVRPSRHWVVFPGLECEAASVLPTQPSHL